MKEFLELFAAVEGTAHCGDVAPCLGVSKANNRNGAAFFSYGNSCNIGVSLEFAFN
jgi:hypothetical protein